jgi:hypothetical protein
MGLMRRLSPGRWIDVTFERTAISDMSSSSGSGSPKKTFDGNSGGIPAARVTTC